MAAKDHAERAIALYDPQEHREHRFLYGGHDPCTCCLSWTAQCLWMMGYPDQAVQRGRQALSLAVELAHPTSLALTHWGIGILSQLRRDVSQSQEQAEACQRLVDEHGLQVFPSALLGWAQAEQGQLEGGLKQLRETVAESTMAPLIWRVYSHILLAEACLKSRKPQEALATLAEARKEVGDTGVSCYWPEVHRLQGEALMSAGAENVTEAETCFHRAIDVARRQQAKTLELRAAASLCRLHWGSDKLQGARSTLAEIFSWFTDGFDSQDLQAAKNLLESSSP